MERERENPWGKHIGQQCLPLAHKYKQESWQLSVGNQLQVLMAGVGEAISKMPPVPAIKKKRNLPGTPGIYI